MRPDEKQSCCPKDFQSNLSFDFYKILYSDAGFVPQPLYVDRDDIPAIADIDGDSDFDFVTLDQKDGVDGGGAPKFFMNTGNSTTPIFDGSFFVEHAVCVETFHMDNYNSIDFGDIDGDGIDNIEDDDDDGDGVKDRQDLHPTDASRS